MGQASQALEGHRPEHLPARLFGSSSWAVLCVSRWLELWAQRLAATSRALSTRRLPPGVERRGARRRDLAVTARDRHRELVPSVRSSSHRTHSLDLPTSTPVRQPSLLVRSCRRWFYLKFYEVNSFSLRLEAARLWSLRWRVVHEAECRHVLGHQGQGRVFRT